MSWKSLSAVCMAAMPVLMSTMLKSMALSTSFLYFASFFTIVCAISRSAASTVALAPNSLIFRATASIFAICSAVMCLILSSLRFPIQVNSR